MVGCCDGGSILFREGDEGGWHPDPPVLWRIDAEGEVVWVVELAELSNGSRWWYPWIVSDYDLRKEFDIRGVAAAVNGTFVFTGNLQEPFDPDPEPFIFKIQDPSLVGAECPEHYLLAAILLIPIYAAWRRRRTRPPA